MEFTKTNPNYCVSVVALKVFEAIPKADRIKVAKIYGNSVIVSAEAKEGDIFLFFPIECSINSEFLANNNLFKKHEFGNKNPEKPVGFFEENGRVKALRLRGVKSEGFAIPLDSLSYTGVDLSEFIPGIDFDGFDSFQICKKYVPKRNKVGGIGNPGKQIRKVRLDDLIVDSQLRLHKDTSNLRRNSHIIKPETIVQISTKMHGSSIVAGNLLTIKPLNWYEKILKRLGVVVKDTQYGLVVTSRTVVKSVGEKAKDGSFHYYKEDIWSNAADKFIKNKLPAGYTIYGEIVGYTPSGGAIQSCKEGPYSYGCAPGESALYVYRVTNTNADGMVLELNRDQRIAFCERYGFTPVPELYYGSAYNFVDQREAVAEDFGETFVKACEESYVRDQDCDLCKNGVPAEGVVVTIDMFDRTDSYKLKSWRFLSGVETPQLDAGVIDIETEESISV